MSARALSPLQLSTSLLSGRTRHRDSCNPRWRQGAPRSAASRVHFRVLATSASQATAQGGSESPAVPTPVVIIDQHSEPYATVVELEFGDRLGALQDTMAALRQLGLNVIRGKVATTASRGRNRFVITKGNLKVEDPELIEAIRGTIISKLLEFHPDSRERLAMARGLSQEAAALKVEVPTKILVQSIDGGKRSELYVETADYPGLLLDITQELSDLSISVESAEIDTEGFVAKDHFYVSYHDQALDEDMTETVKNALSYFLSRHEIEVEESY